MRLVWRGRAVLTSLALLTAGASCMQSQEEPIDVGIQFASAICEGDFDDAVELAHRRLLEGRARGEFGEAMRQVSGCRGSVADFAGQAGIRMESATVRTRHELEDGSVHLHQMELHDAGAGWEVTEFGKYDGEWPPGS